MTDRTGLNIEIPGRGELLLRHLVLDFNGTLACDGRLIRGVAGRLKKLRKILAIEVLTADTFGTASRALRRTGIPCTVIANGRDKARRVRTLGASSVVAIGNGRNDLEMFRAAALSICVLGAEGAFSQAVTTASLVAPSIHAALDLLLNPGRLTAGLRS